jgi:hypothetical protein
MNAVVPVVLFITMAEIKDLVISNIQTLFVT